jgi:outer membrane protein
MGSLCLALALAVLACASMVRADEILSLDQAIAIALLDNPSVEIAGLDVDKTAEDINAARADYFPQMKATLASTRNLVEQSYTFDEGVFGTFAATGPIPAETTEIDTSSGWSNSVGLSVVQSLTGVYQVMMEVEKLSLQERMNAETLRSELQDTAKSVKQTYYQILAS